jgi:hypothetical protein
MEVAGTDGASMAESGRVEWWWGVLMDEGEIGETVLCSTLHEDKAATTWGGGHRWRTVITAPLHAMSRARTGDRRKPFERPLRLTSGP